MPDQIYFQRWSYAIISTALALLILASFWVEKTIRQQLQSDVRLALEAVLKAETRGVRAWYEQQQVLTQTLANHPLILKTLQAETSVADSELRAWLSQTPYSEYLLVSTDKKILRSSHPLMIQAWNTVSEPVKQLAQKGSNRLTEIRVKSQNKEEIYLAMLTPIRFQGRVQGLLVFKLNPERSFPSLLQGEFWGQSAETYLIDPHGLMLTPSRFENQLKSVRLLPANQSSALHLKVRNPEVNLLEFPQRIPAEKQSLTPMASDLIAGRSGTRLVPYRDYRGVPVIGSWHWDKELELGIVTEVDADEAFQGMYQTEWLLYGFTFFAVCLLLGLSRAFYDSHLHLEKVRARLQKQKAHFHSIFENSQDATLILDGENIHDCNSAALHLLSYSKKELLGLAWHAISPLYQPDGQASITDSRGRLLEALTGKKLRFEWRFETSYGERFNADVRLSPLRIEDVAYCQVTIRERPDEND